jgi:hypothetical protein
MIEIDIDPTTLENALRRLEKVPYALQRAIMPAVHEMLQGVADRVSDYLESDVPLPAKLSRKAVRISGVRLDGSTVVGEINVRSKKIPLIHYDVRPKEITARPGLPSRLWPGFSYALRDGERRSSASLIKGSGLPFVAQMPGGHVGIYFRPGYKSGHRKSGLWGTGRRGTKEHDAIKQVYGPSVQYHVLNPALGESITKEASDAFPAILARYVEQAIAEFGGQA